MRISLDIASQLTSSLPALTVDAIKARGGRKFAHERQRFIGHLLETAYDGRARHRRQPEATAFAHADLAKGLRTEDRIPELLDPFFTFPRGTQGYSPRSGTCRAYRIKPDAHDAVDAAMKDEGPADAILEVTSGDGAPVGLSTRNPIPFDALPASGVLANLPEPLEVPKVFPLTVGAIDRASEIVAERTRREGPSAPLDPSKVARGFTLEDARRRLHVCRRWVMSVGGLPNLYRLESTGRLGPLGPHVITLPRYLRSMLLQGSGLLDVDLSACFWSIVLSIAPHLGRAIPAIEDYRGDRERHHRRWAALCGVEHAAAFKPVTLSFLTGGGLTGHPSTAAVHAIGSDAVARLKTDSFVCLLRREAREVVQRITLETLRRATDGKETVYVNAAEARLPEQGRTTRQLESKLAMHALVGFEQVAIRAVCRRVQGLKGILYDGFLCDPQDTAGWSAVVAQESAHRMGFPLNLSFKVDDLRGEVVNG